MAAFSLTSCEDVPEPYTLPTDGGGDTPSATVDPAGAGTLADPYNIAALQQEAEKLASGESSTENVYFKGIVSSIKEAYTSTYGNGTFYVSDDGSTSNQFYVYRAYYLGNEKYKDGDAAISVGDTVVICGKLTNYNGTLETVQNGAYIYSINGSGSGDSGDTPAATGDGTLENPFNSVAASNYAASLGSGVASDKEVYIKGKVASIVEEFSTQYGNGTFYISDDGTSAGQFYVFRIYYLGNQKFASGDTQIKVGDDVVVCGKVINYMGNTPETVQGSSYLYSLNGKTSSGGSDTPASTGDGTLENPFTAVGAANYASSLASGASSDKEVYIKGKISSIKEEYSTTYGNGTFYISDDGTTTNQFYVFRALYLGNKKFTSGDTQIKVGDDVIVYGKVMNYMGNTPETVQNAAYLYSLTSNGGGGTSGGGDVSGNSITVTASSFGLDNQTDLTTLTLSDGTTLTFDGGGNSNGPKYYTTGTSFRMYPKNSVTVSSSKTISSIQFVCDEYNSAIYNASGDISASSGTVSTSGVNVSVSGISSKSVKLTNTSSTTGSASQIRMKSITINYAE